MLKQLTFSQLAIIGVVMLSGGAGIIYVLVLFQIFLEPLRLPSALETMILISFVLVCLYGLGYFLKRIYARAIKNE